MSDKITFHFVVTSFFFPYRRLLKQFLIGVAGKESKKVESINYIFCTDNHLKKLNKRYLKHNTYTDVITFPYSSTAEPILADIFISTDRVKENASHYHTSFKTELQRVIFHGLLHLCGYQDETSQEILIMRSKEETLIERFLFHVKQSKTTHPMQTNFTDVS